MSENILELKNLASTLRARSQKKNFQALKNLVRSEIHPIPANNILLMLDALAPDLPCDGGPLLGFINAPAAKRNHHAYQGGLVIHLLEMWEIWKDRFKQDFPRLGDVTDDRILEGIIYHDLHKAYRTFRLASLDPWKVDYLRDDPDNESMTWEAKTIWLLMGHGIKLDVEQYNALLWSEGGWAKTQPRWCSVLAKVLYLMDEYSGNVLSRIQDGTWRDVSETKK